jgi:hypothetical protein
LEDSKKSHSIALKACRGVPRTYNENRITVQGSRDGHPRMPT